MGCGTSCEEKRQPNDKELQRIQDAQHTCKRIRLLPLAHTEKLFTARLTAVSKAAFGWVAATPSEALSKAFDTAVRATSDAFRDGSKHLHNVLLGATRCLSPVVGVKQVLLWCKSLAQEQWDDTRRRVSTLQRLAQDFLHQVGWVFTRGKWAHRSLGFFWKTQDGSSKAGRDKIAHMVRESWRHLFFVRFTTWARRDAIPFRRTAYDAKRIGLVRELLHHTDGAAAALITGSFTSPAAFAKRQDVPARFARCPMCNHDQADQRHLFWSCALRRTTGRPADALQARFGWPRSRKDTKALEGMALTVEAVWSARHAVRGLCTTQVYRPKGFKLKARWLKCSSDKHKSGKHKAASPAGPAPALD